jgi:hypothetical protein
MGILAPAADERVSEIAVTDELLSVRLKDGRIISVPLQWYPRLLGATKKQRSNWKLSPDEYGIHWPDIDEDLNTEGLLLGMPAAKNTAPIKREPVKSRTIASMGYSRDTQMLEIEFRNSGEVYRYLGVPETEYENLRNAESKGTYLNKEFKKAGFRYLKIK